MSKGTRLSPPIQRAARAFALMQVPTRAHAFPDSFRIVTKSFRKRSATAITNARSIMHSMLSLSLKMASAVASKEYNRSPPTMCHMAESCQDYCRGGDWVYCHICTLLDTNPSCQSHLHTLAHPFYHIAISRHKTSHARQMPTFFLGSNIMQRSINYYRVVQGPLLTALHAALIACCLILLAHALADL